MLGNCSDCSPRTGAAAKVGAVATAGYATLNTSCGSIFSKQFGASLACEDLYSSSRLSSSSSCFRRCFRCSRNLARISFKSACKLRVASGRNGPEETQSVAAATESPASGLRLLGRSDSGFGRSLFLSPKDRNPCRQARFPCKPNSS